MSILMKLFLLGAIIFFSCFVVEVKAQVTIGSIIPPNTGALVDLKETNDLSTKGMLLPRVELKNLNSLTMGDNIIPNDGDSWIHHAGLLVYNVTKIETATNRICPGVHIWTGENWEPIVPYADVLSQKVPKSLIRSFQYLESNPASPNFDISLWPSEKQKDAKEGKYILGNSLTNNTENLVDIRNTESNTYYTSRFYVGYKVQDITYLIQESYKCDTSEPPIWVDISTVKEKNKIFSDGIWTTQNLNTTKFPDGTDIPVSTSQTSTTSPYYANPANKASNATTYGRLYNWPATINMGTSKGQTPDPLNIDQGGNNEDVIIQGICPNGWHVPNAQEWVDLFNGIAKNISLFSTLTTDSGPAFTYKDINVYVNPSLRNAMLSAFNSKKANEGGFYALYAGREQSIGYGTVAYFWSASSILNTGASAYGYYLANFTNSGVRVESIGRALNFSVRCIKSTI